jgi:hypothetical protein
MRVRGLKKVFTFYIIKHYCFYPLREDLTAEGRTRVEDAEVRKGRSFLNQNLQNFRICRIKKMAEMVVVVRFCKKPKKPPLLWVQGLKKGCRLKADD